ncbi:DUF4127 family protein, partial [bacterium]|nr:DUF4127 family protein [bacterium]
MRSTDKILFIPLDDRPCCWRFPQRLAKMAGVDLISLPFELWQSEELISWCNHQHLEEAILSLDMLAYGGLVASRLPASVDCCWPKVTHFLEQLNIQKLVAFSTIMRVAPTQTNISEVEQANLLTSFSQSLADKYKFSADSLSNFLDDLQTEIKAVLSEYGLELDFWNRYLAYRKEKHALNLRLVDCWPRESDKFLALGLDDTKTQGINIWEAEELKRASFDKQNIVLGAGTDEVAMLLLARLLNPGQKVKVGYSHRGAEEQVTLYEGRPLKDVVTSQAQWADLSLTEEDSEVQLWIYAPWDRQREAVYQYKQSSDLPKEYLNIWLDRLKKDIDDGHKIVVADLAYANGGSYRLVESLSQKKLLHQLSGYAAWNTAGNALGTALAWASLLNKNVDLDLNRRFLLERILDDYYYQARLRPRLSERVGGNFVKLSDSERIACETEIRTGVIEFMRTKLRTLT